MLIIFSDENNVLYELCRNMHNHNYALTQPANFCQLSFMPLAAAAVAFSLNYIF